MYIQDIVTIQVYFIKINIKYIPNGFSYSFSITVLQLVSYLLLLLLLVRNFGKLQCGTLILINK